MSRQGYTVRQNGLHQAYLRNIRGGSKGCERICGGLFQISQSCDVPISSLTLLTGGGPLAKSFRKSPASPYDHMAGIRRKADRCAIHLTDHNAAPTYRSTQDRILFPIAAGDGDLSGVLGILPFRQEVNRGVDAPLMGQFNCIPQLRSVLFAAYRTTKKGRISPMAAVGGPQFRTQGQPDGHHTDTGHTCSVGTGGTYHHRPDDLKYTCTHKSISFPAAGLKIVMPAGGRWSRLPALLFIKKIVRLMRNPAGEEGRGRWPPHRWSAA